MSLPPPPRKLSARRSSSTAADPYALNRSSSSSLASSVLTIVRVADNDPSLSSHSRRSISLKNNQPVDQAPGRVSFAFASFGGRGRGGPARPPQRGRQESPPHSPTRARGSSTYSAKPNLSPDELYQLAKQSVEPSPAGAPQIIPANGGNSQDRSNSTSVPPPLVRAGSNSSIKSVESTTSPAPAFTPLEDSVFLPYVDRPAEVTQLITTLPTLKLFVLLDKTLPKDPDYGDEVPSSRYTANRIPKDPRRWTYDHLYTHLTTSTREACPDALWVAQARMCIISHSELIWERIKGAIGVPVELDYQMSVEQLFIEIERTESMVIEEQAQKQKAAHAPDPPVDSPSRNRRNSNAISDLNTDEISDDEGMKARGHWNDWDFILDSPVYDRRGSFGSGVVPPNLLFEEGDLRGPLSPDEEELKSQLGSKLHELQKSRDNPTTKLSTVVTSPLHISTSPDIITSGTTATPVAIPASASCPDSPHRVTTHYTASYPLNIAAILKNGAPEHASPGLKPPPLSIPSNLAGPTEIGLGDIAEGEEEEYEEERSNSVQDPVVDPPLDPSNVQGLRLSVSACSIPSYTVPIGSIDDIDDPGPYDPVGERERGKPLFPSSFARLTAAPTLSANNPALRSHKMSQGSGSRSFSGFTTRAGQWGGRLNMTKPFSENESDYAVSMGSFGTSKEV